MAVKVPSVIETAEDIFDLPVKSDGDTVVTLSDVADIRRTFKDRQSYARVNGNTSISLNVTKRPGANLVDTVAQVRGRGGALPRRPAGLPSASSTLRIKRPSRSSR